MALIAVLFALALLAAGCPRPLIRFFPPGEKPTLDGLLTEFPHAHIYAVHQQNIYKALLLVPIAQKFDPTGWIWVRKRARARDLARDMQSYLGEHRAVWKAVTDGRGDTVAYLLTSVGGGYVHFRDGTLVVDPFHFLDEFRPTSVPDDAGEEP